MNIEDLAKAIHYDSGEAAAEAHASMNKTWPDELEWEELSNVDKNAYRILAKKIFERIMR